MHLLSVNILQELLRTQHHVVQRELALLGIGPDTQLASQTISWSRACESIERALASADDPGLPLRAGAAVSMWSMRTLGVALTCAPSVRHLIGAIIRLTPLVLSGTRYQLHEHEGEAQVSFELPASPPVSARAAVEFVLAFTARWALESTPPEGGGIRRALVRHAAPAHAALYAQTLGFPVLFSADKNAWCCDAADLDLPLPSGDHPLFAMLFARAEQALLEQNKAASTALRMKQLLREANLETVDVAQLASHLGLGVTALQRKLKSESTTFSKLLDEVRRELALAQIGQQELSIKDLTERLGFSEPSAFYRAFRRWTSLTPQAYRAQRGLGSPLTG